MRAHDDGPVVAVQESAANGSGQKGRGGSGRGGRGRGGGSAAKRARGGVLTLQDLIDGGIIFPGRHKISVHYKGTVYTASLGKDGMILYQGAPPDLSIQRNWRS